MKRISKSFSRLLRNSFSKNRTTCAILCAILSLCGSISSYGQVYYPPKDVPIDQPAPRFGSDTVFNDSLHHFLAGVSPWYSYPKQAIMHTLYPDYERVTASIDNMWSWLQYNGLAVTLNTEAFDPAYLYSFTPGQKLLRQSFTLQVFAPGDSIMRTPIYQDDSIMLEITGWVPQTELKISLDKVLAKYIPPEGLGGYTTDKTDTFVNNIIDSTWAAIYNGKDSLIVNKTLVSMAEAQRLADSAETAFRGIAAASSLAKNLGIGYKLIPNKLVSYVAPGFSTAGINTHVYIQPYVIPHGGTLPPWVSPNPYPGPVIVHGWPWPWVIPNPNPNPNPGPGSGPCGDMPLTLTTVGVTLTNPVKYMWLDCPYPNYEIQILRLYNIDSTLTTDEHNIKVLVDWSQALDLETNDGTQNIRLTTAEGTGYYVWRVRRIDDSHPNTIGDNQNWGAWTTTGAFTDGNIVTVTPGMINSYLFFYQQFDDSLNWIYHRQFVEGEIDHGSQLRIGEKNTYANYLLMPVQDQVRAQSADMILASQTIPDHSGRPALQTLPAPINTSGFGYEYNYIQNSSGLLYTANDFDLQTNYVTPGIVNGTSKLVKYYSNINGDRQIPNSDSLPFTRTLNYNDGLNRPREIASPGKYHNFGSNHTVKKYYCSATATELIRIFGDEAPRPASVLKTYTVDPNGVFNISYTDEITGKVLATCLSAPESNLLDSLPGGVFFVRDTVEAKVPGHYPSRLVETKTYTFAVPTSMREIYKVVPNIYGDSCLGICATCDYVVHITASNIDDSVPSHQYQHTIIVSPGVDSLGGACTSIAYVDSQNYSIIPIGPGSTPSTILDPGTYVTTATVLLGNSDPATGVPYITMMDSMMVRKLHNTLMTGPGYVPGPGGHTGLQLNTVLTYIAAMDMDGLLLYTGADTSQPYFKYIVGCDTLTLPTAHCKKHDCSVIDFAEYMVAQVAQYDVDHGTSVFTGLTDIAATTDASNLFLLGPSGGNAEFNNIIGHMIADGYNCDTLWNAWVATVTWYAGVQGATTTGTMGPSTQKADWWQHFMELAGYKFAFTPHPAVELTTPGSQVRLFPYKYFPYDMGTNPGAEDAFCYAYEVRISFPIPGGTYACSHPSPAYTTPGGWMIALDNFPAYGFTDDFHMYAFYKQIKPSSPTYTGPLVPPGGLGFSGGSTTIDYVLMEHECYDRCNSRYGLLADAIADKYMKSGAMVDGYSYLSWYPHPAVDTIPMPHIYCMASALVTKCKDGCTLTPDPVTGVVPPAQIKAYQQSMTYSMAIQVSLTDSPVCSTPFPIGYDTTVIVIHDSLKCDTNGGYMHCDTTHFYTDSTYMIITGYDSGYVSVCNTDTSYSEELAMLDWLNHLYDHLYDSLHAIGYSSIYTWDPMTYPGVSSFSTYVPGCYRNLPIDVHHPKGYFRYDTITTYMTDCPSNRFTVYRYAPKHAFISSAMHMEVDVVIAPGGDVAAGDSIVFVENIPGMATLLSHNGLLVGSSIHLISVGPIATGDTLKLLYDMVMPPVSGTIVPYASQAIRYVSGVASACTPVTTTTSADRCVKLFFISDAAKNGEGKIPMCDICHAPMGCEACICMHFDPPGAPTGDSVHVISCAEFVTNAFSVTLQDQIQTIADRHSGQLRYMYDQLCNKPEAINDNFVNIFQLNQYQYTLYYYDRAGNLVRTVAPRGVRDTATGRYSPPGHYDVTEYDYNSLGQMLRQKTPDGGNTNFWYDKRGKVRLSQNNKQQPLSSYSYTKYDELARVIEAGEITSYYVSMADVDDPTFPQDGGPVNKQYITRTFYSVPCPTSLPLYGTFTGNFLQNRISYVQTDLSGAILPFWITPTDRTTTIYSYDAHGNVATQIEYVSSAPEAVRIDYQYDQISNKVVKMSQGKLHNTTSGLVQEDYLAHKYSYDGDKRLTAVSSAWAPGSAWTTDATYSYYLHGPLRRMQLGGNLQGLDYTYTLEGWLKAINHSSLLKVNDPGGDSSILGGTRGDIFGMVLNYYQGDFNRAGSIFNSIGNPMNITTTDSVLNGGGDLYNGNITSWMSNIRPIGGTLPEAYAYQTAYTYRYDQLNRIKRAAFNVYDNGGMLGTPNYWHRPYAGIMTLYDERFSYDKNGNILTLERWSNSPLSAPNDNLTYNYNVLGTATLNTLASIGEAASPAVSVGDAGNSSYIYDNIGQLAEDHEPDENRILKIKWTPYNKVDTVQIYDNAGTLQGTHRYLYNGIGNQVRDIYITSTGTQISYNVYDAHSVKLVGYQIGTAIPGTSTMQVQERYLYGRDRIATLRGTNAMGTTTGGAPWVVGPVLDKSYEIHDHLGNVRATFSNSIPGPSGVTPLAYYNYYAFGSEQLHRSFEPSGIYSFGFNGQVRKDDMRGSGNSYEFKYRGYDARIGRFNRVDPLANDFAWNSPYSFAENRVIDGVDFEGLEFKKYSESHTTLIVFPRNSDKNEFQPAYDAAIKTANVDVVWAEGVSDLNFWLAKTGKKYKQIINESHGGIHSQDGNVGFMIGLGQGSWYYNENIKHYNHGEFVELGSHIAEGGTFIALNCFLANSTQNANGPELMQSLANTLNANVIGNTGETNITKDLFKNADLTFKGKYSYGYEPYRQTGWAEAFPNAKHLIDISSISFDINALLCYIPKPHIDFSWIKNLFNFSKSNGGGKRGTSGGNAGGSGGGGAPDGGGQYSWD